MSEQDDTPAAKLQIPDEYKQKLYWMTQDQSWRTEPEIDTERQQYLEERRSRRLGKRKYIFPLKDVSLSRADIEWLLATHENSRGPVDWNDPDQRERQGLDLFGADLRGIDLSKLPLANVDLSDAHLEGAKLYDAHLENANFVRAYLEGADLSRAHLESALLLDAHLERASLNHAHLEATMFMSAHLEGADLSGSFLDAETDLNSITLFNQKVGGVILADVRWRDANVAVVDWSVLSRLGDERVARQSYASKAEDKVFILEFFKRATRAYRQVAVVLRNQGLNEDAVHFAYRAQLMQRIVFRLQRKVWHYLGSLFLDVLTGYGYKPLRSFLVYLIVIMIFGTTQ